MCLMAPPFLLECEHFIDFIDVKESTGKSLPRVLHLNLHDTRCQGYDSVTYTWKAVSWCSGRLLEINPRVVVSSCACHLQFVAGRHFKDVFGGNGIIWYPSKNVCLLLSTQRWVVFTKKVKDWTVKPDGNVA